MYRLQFLLLCISAVIYGSECVSQGWPTFKSVSKTKSLQSPRRYNVPNYKAPSPERIILDRSFAGVRPLNYDLTLKLPVQMDNRLGYEGSLSINMLAVDPVRTILLHADGMRIVTDRITVTDTKLLQNVPIDSVIIEDEQQLIVINTEQYLIANREYIVTIPKFDGILKSAFSVGIFANFVHQTQTSHESIIATQFQLDNARTVFPCIDVPHFKSNLSLNLLYPPNYRALGNMQSSNIQYLADGWLDETFATTPALPTYTMALALMPQSYRPISRSSIIGTKITLHYDVHKTTDGHARKLMEYALHAINWYQSHFNVTLPLRKIDMVMIPQFVVQGMENFGLITLNQNYLHRIEEPEQYSLIAHELAHQWFSNLVTVAGWDHICFQEGITDHFARKLVKLYFGNSQQAQRYLTDKYTMAILDESRQIPPVSLIVPSNPLLSQVSNRCFGKNVFLMDSLESLVGETTFLHRINIFLHKYQNSHARLEDFIREFETTFVDSVKMSDFIREWFTKPGYPSIFVYRNYRDNSVLLRQQQVYPKSTSYTQIPGNWPIPVSSSSKSSTIPLSITMLSHPEYRLHSVPLNSNEYMVINHNFSGFYRVNYDLHNWNLLAETLLHNPQHLSILTRTQLISDFCFFNRIGLIANSAQVQKIMFESVAKSPHLFRAHKALMHRCAPQLNNRARFVRRRQISSL